MPAANVSLEEIDNMYFKFWQLTSAFIHPTAHGGEVGRCALMDCLLKLHPHKGQSGMPADTPPTERSKGLLAEV